MVSDWLCYGLLDPRPKTDAVFVRIVEAKLPAALAVTMQLKAFIVAAQSVIVDVKLEYVFYAFVHLILRQSYHTGNLIKQVHCNVY